MAPPRQSPPAQADGGANGGVQGQAGSRQGNGEAPQANAQYGTAVWERRRAEWLALQQSGVEPAVGRQGPVLGYDDMADLLQSMQPFPRPVPLSELVDFLVDCWDSEGLYTGLNTSSSSGEVSPPPSTLRRRAPRVVVLPPTPGTEPLLPLAAPTSSAGGEVKRRRGRPPGSRNKPRLPAPPLVVTEQLPLPAGEPVVQVPPIVRRRGRPRKAVTAPPPLPPPSALRVFAAARALRMTAVIR